MPKSHRDTMEVLFVFLKWVASFAHMDAETGSKMDLENLAKVICPSILYARGRDPLRDETLSGVHVVTLLLESQDEFFTVPEDFLTILHDQEYFANSMDLPSKEFLKKCDTYNRVKGGGGSNGRSMPGTPYLNQSNGAQQQQQQQPRYPPPVSSPAMERPPPPPGSAGPSNGPERNNARGDSYPPPGSSPPMSQGMQSQGIVQNMQRTPQMDDWSPTPPPALPRTANRSRSPSSRPSSFVGPSSSRPLAGGGGDPSQQQQQLLQTQGLPYNHPAVMNGYPSAAAAASAGGGRQRQ
jgi:hypothetical protein